MTSRTFRILVISLTLLTTVSAFAAVGFTYRGYPIPAVPTGIDSGDLNKDGVPDLVVASNQNGRWISVYRNSGTNFGTPTNYALSFDPDEVFIFDANNDGWLDIMVTFPDNAQVTVLLNDGDGTFDQAASHTVLRFPLKTAAVQDFNNDGNVDFAGQTCDTSNFCVFEYWLGLGNGGFAKKEGNSSRNLWAIDAIDINRDGRSDVIGVDPGVAIATLLMGSDGFMHEGPRIALDGVESVTWGDFNNDSYVDLAAMVPHPCGSACGDNTVYTYINNKSGGWTLRSQFNIGPSAGGELKTADLNGDLSEDLVVVNAAHFGGGVRYALGQGNGFFGSQGGLAFSEPAGFIERDFNRDSRHDLAVPEWLGQSLMVATNTGAYRNCATPNSDQVRVNVCGPLPNATLTGSALVTASANSPAGIKRIEVWIDGKKAYEKWNDQINKRFALSPGRHRIAVIGVDEYKGTSLTAVYVNVQ